MRAEYKRDLQNNYLILEMPEGTEDENYGVRMAEQNEIMGLLPFHSSARDGKRYLHYEITSKQALGDMYEKKALRYQDIVSLLTGIEAILKEMQKYLLNPAHLIFDPQYIYFEPGRNRVWLCYLPGDKDDFSITLLAEFILKKLDHEEEQAVMLGYSFYQSTVRDNFSLQQTLKALLVSVNERGRGGNQEWVKEGQRKNLISDINDERGRSEYGRNNYMVEYGAESYADGKHISGKGNIRGRNFIIGKDNTGEKSYDMGKDNAGGKSYAAERGDTGGRSYAGGKGDTGGRNYAARKGDIGGRNYATGKGDTGGRNYATGKGDTGGRNYATGKGDTGGRSYAGGKGDTGRRNYAAGKGDTGGRNYAVGKGGTGGSSYAAERGTIGGSGSIVGGEYVPGEEEIIASAREEQCSYFDQDSEEYKVDHRERRSPKKEKAFSRLFQIVHPGVLLSSLFFFAALEVIFYFGFIHLTEAGGLFFLLISVEILINKFWKRRKEKKKAEEKCWDLEDEDEMYQMLQEEMYEQAERPQEIEETCCLASPGGDRGMKLIFSGSSDAQEMFPDIIFGREPVYVGKIKGDTDVILDSSTVSRVHARLEQREDRFYIRDLNSKNGTFHNGKRLEPQEQCEIVSGDRIMFAEIEYRAVYFTRNQ